MAKSISIAIIVAALTVANLLPAAECNANRGGGGSVTGEDDFNDRVSKTGGESSRRVVASSAATELLFLLY